MMFEKLVTALANKNISLTRQQIIYLKLLCKNKLVPTNELTKKSLTNISTVMSQINTKFRHADIKCRVSSTKLYKEYAWGISCE